MNMMVVAPAQQAPAAEAAITTKGDLYFRPYLAQPLHQQAEDGDVDGDDFLLWQTGFGTPSGAAKMDGDYDNDGDVDGDDFLGWQREFGSGSGSIGVAIPEPASMAMLLVMT